VRRAHRTLIVALLLCLLFGLQVTSAVRKAPTYDEQAYIARGYAWVRLGDLHIRIGTPILLNALNALPLLSLPDVRLPVDDPSWAGTGFHAIGERFMWHANGNADQILFVARVPTMFLALLLAALSYRWAGELFGPWGALLTLALCTLDPNVIAHGRLATTDLGFATAFTLAAYATWRMLRQPSWPHVLLAGISLGLAQGTKFSALAMGPILAALYLWRAALPAPFALPLRQHKPTQRQVFPARVVRVALAGALVVLIAYLTLWAIYGFQVGPIEGGTSFPVLAPAHFEQLLDISGRLSGQEGRESPGFLMGEHYTGGRWQYFPIALALKTPIPALILSLAGVVVCLGATTRDCPYLGEDLRSARLMPRLLRPIGTGGRMLWAVWLPPALFFAASLRSNLNLGYRYILPVVPFLHIMAGAAGAWIAGDLTGFLKPVRSCVVVGVALLGWAAWSGLSIWPDYLAYFNELAGGPDGGWRYLIESNLDWGQDLKGLARWMEVHDVEQVRLAYYGEAYPSYYGIAFEPLTGWPDRRGHHLYRAFYPHDPQPGTYAISVNLLQGRNLPDRETYAWFRARTPLDKVGYSIFIYQVLPRGEGKASLALSDVALSDVRPEDYARLGTNDVRPLWFDGARALAAPGDELEDRRVWVLARPLHPALAPMLPLDGAGCAPSGTLRGQQISICEDDVYAWLLASAEAAAIDAPAWNLSATRFVPGDPPNHGQRLDYPVVFGGRFALLGYELDFAERLTLVTYWRVLRKDDAPIRLFAHLLDAESDYRGGEDRFDVWHGTLWPGDLIAQVQELALSPDAPPGEYQLEIGWYNPDTMQRLPVLEGTTPIADRVLLRPVRME